MTLKEAKKDFLVNTAQELFLEKSISDVSIKDVAKKAGTGEATIYRHFVHKKNLVLAVAEKLQKAIFDDYFSALEAKTGYESIGRFFENYVSLFKERTELFRFVKDFDAYAISEGGMKTENYSLGIDRFKSAFLEAYERGVKDGSVRIIEEPEVFYFCSAHAMLELCKKLSSGEKIVKQDESLKALSEIETLKETFLYFLAPAQDKNCG